jgi:hypothetical protein
LKPESHDKKGYHDKKKLAGASLQIVDGHWKVACTDEFHGSAPWRSGSELARTGALALYRLVWKEIINCARKSGDLWQNHGFWMLGRKQ